MKRKTVTTLRFGSATYLADYEMAFSHSLVRPDRNEELLAALRALHVEVSLPQIDRKLRKKRPVLWIFIPYWPGGTYLRGAVGCLRQFGYQIAEQPYKYQSLLS